MLNLIHDCRERDRRMSHLRLRILQMNLELSEMEASQAMYLYQIETLCEKDLARQSRPEADSNGE